MAQYVYKVKNKLGNQVGGVVEAETEASARELLEEREFLVVELRERRRLGILEDALHLVNRIPVRERVIFARQLSVLIDAGVREVQALQTLMVQTANARLKTIVADIAREVEGGAKLSEALAKHPHVFGDFFIGIVRSGETTGRLAEVIEYLADQEEKDYDLRQRIKGAMTYPIFIVGGLVVVGFVMMIYVVPKLTDVLKETGAELPLSTKLLIGASSFLVNYWWLVIVLLAAFFVTFILYTKREDGRRRWDTFKLRVPLFGKILQKLYLVRFTRSMFTLYSGDVDVVQSLKIVAPVVGNAAYQELILKTAKEVEDGNSIATEFLQSNIVPKMIGQMLAVGEESGKSKDVFEKLTNFYTREVDNSVQSLVTLIEPIIMVVIGVAVGIMVAAVILPMYNLAGQF